MFVRLSLGKGVVHPTDDNEVRSPVDVATAPEKRAKIIDEYKLASRVEVRTQYQRGQWAPGYEIAQVVDSGYHVRRLGSLEVLPEIFVPMDVRRAGEDR
ncbi:MAG: hypothetical protein ACYDD4_02895 [Acidimicrobiales bacterium]